MTEDRTLQQRLIVEPFDPRRPMAGGVDTCIRDLVKFAPDDITLSIVGVDAVGDLPLGHWTEQHIGGRPVRFMAVYRGDNSVIRSRVPHAVRIVAGVTRYRRRMGRPTFVQTHRVSISYAVRRLFRGVDHVQFVHNDGQTSLTTGTESYFTRAVWAFRFLERDAVRHSTDVVVFNAEATERLEKLGTVVRFSPTWFDEGKFYPATRARGTTSMVWLARFEPPKDPLLAVRALASAPSARLTMVGVGSLLGEAQSLAHELGVADRITFAGLVNKDDVGDTLRSHDALLMTSHHEGFPRAVVEALACGLPVVTTEGGEPNGLVQSGVNGFRSSARDPDAIGALLSRIDEIDSAACSDSVKDLRASILVPRVLGKAA